MTDWNEVLFLGALLGLLAVSRRRDGVAVLPRPAGPRPKPAPLPPEMLTSMRQQDWRNN